MSNAEIRGLFVWHELMTTDPQGADSFYCGLFRWVTHPSSVPGYTLWMSGGVGVSGLMAQPEEVRHGGAPPSWLLYLGTSDVDATVQAAQRLGGRVLKQAADIPGIGRFAVLADPQGAAFALFTPAARIPGDTAAPDAHSQFSWHELATSDPQGALEFYAPLFGWNEGPAHDMGGGNTYQIIEREGAPIGGIYRLQDPSKPPHWLTYVKVDNLDGTVAAARTAGGQVIREPHEVPGGDRVAWILDPQGGAVALHETPKAVVSPARKRPRARKAVRRRAPASRARRRPAKRPPARATRSKASPSRVKAKTQSKAKTRSVKTKTAPRRSGVKRKNVKSPARQGARRSAAAQNRARKSVKLKKRPSTRATSKKTRTRKPAKRAKRKPVRRH